MLEVDAAIAREDQGAREAFLHLAHVERPSVQQKRARGRGGERHALRCGTRQLPKQGGEEEPDVLAPLAHGWQVESETGQAREKVCAKEFLGCKHP